MLFNRFITLAAVPVLALVLCVSSVSYPQQSNHVKSPLRCALMAATGPGSY